LRFANREVLTKPPSIDNRNAFRFILLEDQYIELALRGCQSMLFRTRPLSILRLIARIFAEAAERY